MRMVKLQGAIFDDSSGEREYIKDGPVWINTDLVECVFDHIVVFRERKVRVMETAEEIVQRMQDFGSGPYLL